MMALPSTGPWGHEESDASRTFAERNSARRVSPRFVSCAVSALELQLARLNLPHGSHASRRGSLRGAARRILEAPRSPCASQGPRRQYEITGDHVILNRDFFRFQTRPWCQGLHILTTEKRRCGSRQRVAASEQDVGTVGELAKKKPFFLPRARCRAANCEAQPDSYARPAHTCAH